MEMELAIRYFHMGEKSLRDDCSGNRRRRIYLSFSLLVGLRRTSGGDCSIAPVAFSGFVMSPVWPNMGPGDPHWAKIMNVKSVNNEAQPIVSISLCFVFPEKDFIDTIRAGIFCEILSQRTDRHNGTWDNCMRIQFHIGFKYFLDQNITARMGNCNTWARVVNSCSDSIIIFFPDYTAFSYFLLRYASASKRHLSLPFPK